MEIEQIKHVLYRAQATASGGREGNAKSSDGALDVKLSTPTGLGGAGGTGTNPEQLFAAGYSACFLSALRFVAVQKKVALPVGASIQATVDIGPVETDFGIQVELKIALPGVARSVAEELVHSAHKVCPYSNATRGNINVSLLFA